MTKFQKIKNWFKQKIKVVRDFLFPSCPSPRLKPSLFAIMAEKVDNFIHSPRAITMALMLIVCTGAVFAQNAAGNYEAGTNALTTVTEEIAKYVPIVVKLCYAIAGVVAIVGAISVYIAMNNEEQDVKKKIMMVVGACIFLIAAAQALPLFFGLGG